MPMTKGKISFRNFLFIMCIGTMYYQDFKRETHCVKVWWDLSLGEGEELQVARGQVPGVQKQRKPSQSFTSYSWPEHTLKGKQGKHR